MKEKVITVVGARPQFIKAAPVSKALKESGKYHEIMVHTGQHYDRNMSENFFDELDMESPKYNLGVGSGGHAEQTGEIMKRLEPVLIDERPGLIIVYGDTNSTLAGAITASKLHIPIAHVEAGLRSFNRSMPEEVNRIVVDHVSNLLFCPTMQAVLNLESEGIKGNVFNCGDVMYDVAVQFSEKAEEKARLLNHLKIKNKEYVLTTVHRAENTDNRRRLSNILTALGKIACDLPVVVPLHPRTHKMIHYFSLEELLEGLVIIEPLGFLDMLFLERNARLIVTDSGGVQKEAYFQRVPCVTLRNETEWVETLAARWNVLADVDSVEVVTELISASMAFSGVRTDIGEYGDGMASQKIVYELDSYLTLTAGSVEHHNKENGSKVMAVHAEVAKATK
jgi:UDP-GlcNAc3NAcA epimerase